MAGAQALAEQEEGPPQVLACAGGKKRKRARQGHGADKKHRRGEG